MSLASWFRASRRFRQRRLTTRRLGLERLESRDCPSGGHLVVASTDNDTVPRFDASTGADAGPYVTHRSGGLEDPFGVVYGPHDGNLYVSSGLFSGPNVFKGVLRYDRATGSFLNAFTEPGHLDSPRGVVFGPDGHLYVADRLGGADPNAGRVVRFHGTTGAFLDEFVPAGGVGRPAGLVFGPDPDNPGQLDLYVTAPVNHSVSRFDGATGAYRGEFVTPGSGGLAYPAGLTFGPTGDLYVASYALGKGYQAVLRYQGAAGATPGAFIDAFVPPGRGGLRTPFGLLFGPDGNGDGRQDLYVNSAEVNGALGAKDHSSVVLRYDGVTGAFLDTFVAAGSGRLDNPAFMTFTGTDPTTLAYTGQTRFRAAAGSGASPFGPGPTGVVAADAGLPPAGARRSTLRCSKGEASGPVRGDQGEDSAFPVGGPGRGSPPARLAVKSPGGAAVAADLGQSSDEAGDLFPLFGVPV